MSDWGKALGLAVPIVCAPMGGVAGGALAAAVSRSGALGMIGMGSSGSAAALRRELDAFAAAAPANHHPWGIGMVAWGIERDPEMFEMALTAAPHVISVSFGDWSADPPAWISAARQVGIHTVAQVATAHEAHLAETAGVDAVIARGKEGGGHGVHVRPRHDLLGEVLAAVDIPVLSAGAIHAPDQVAEALAAGAAAVWVGTAFQACTEALTDAAAKHTLFNARGEDTLVSRVLDVALGRPWPEHVPERLLCTDFVDRWHGRERELEADHVALATFREAYAAHDYSVVPIDAGEGVTELVSERTAAEVVAALTPEEF